MTRRERQRDELRQLCRSGEVLRAIDLAFEHFADFGHDADIVRLVSAAIDTPAAPATARRRLDELRASTNSTTPAGSGRPADHRHPRPG
jgi:hypothetical protein